MKHFVFALIFSLFALASCDCSPATHFYPAGNSQTVATEGIRDGPRQGRRNANQRLMSHIKERTVLISVDCTPINDDVAKMLKDLGVQNPSGVGDGWGSGIIVRSKKGASYIFTAAHVVEFSNAKMAEYFKCEVHVQREKDAGTKDNKIVASLVAKSTGRDVAVLRVPVDLGVNTELELNPFTGEDIWAAGFPVLKMSRNSKIISITKGTLATANIPARKKSFGNYHRVTSQVYFGNSGGGIWNKEGKLLSIVSSLFTGNGGDPLEGQYNTKPVGEVLHILDKSFKYKEVFGDLN